MFNDTLWRFLNVAAWIAILFVSTLILRRRSACTFIRCVVLLSLGQAIAVPILALGFIVEPALWTLFQRGAIEIPEALAEVLTPYGLLSHTLEPSLLPAGVLAFMTAIPRTRYARIFLCAGGAVLALGVYDLLARIAPLSPSSPLAFSLGSDLVGGAFAGILAGYLSSLLLESASRPSLTLRHVSLGLISVGTAVIAVVGGYLAFLHYLPDPVILDVRAWDSASFEHSGDRFAYSRYLPEMATSYALSTPTGWLTGPLYRGAELDLQAAESSHSGTGRVFIEIAELVRDNADGHLTLSALLSGARTKFSGQIDAGTIQIDSEPFNIAVLLHESTRPQESDGLLMGENPTTPSIRFTYEPRAAVLVAFGGIAESVFSKLNVDSRSQKTLTISAGELNKIRKTAVRQLVAVVGSPPALHWRMGSGGPVEVRITLPNGHVVRALNQPFKDKGWGGLHGVALVVGSPNDPPNKAVVADVGRYVVCPGCRVQLKPRGALQHSVRRLRVSGIEGRLQVGLKEYELKTRGEVFLGSDSMRIEQLDEKTVRVAGRTAPVTLDDVVLSNTVWGTISNEVKAVIVGAVLTVIGGLIGQIVRLYRQAHGRRHPPATSGQS